MITHLLFLEGAGYIIRPTLTEIVMLLSYPFSIRHRYQSIELLYLVRSYTALSSLFALSKMEDGPRKLKFVLVKGGRWRNETVQG